MDGQGRRGFTLIELLIVMVVIGVLASIAIPKFNFTRERAYRNSMVADLKNLANAQEIFHMSNYTYSSSLTNLGHISSQGVVLGVSEANGSGWAATATHPGATGQCGIYYGGAAAAGGDPATEAGVVSCVY